MDRVLPLLHGAKRSGAGWVAHCPAHDDRRVSLSVKEGDDGRVLFHCHAGCAHDAITHALNLEVRDLFEAPSDAMPPASRTIVARYPYQDETGGLLYEVVRFAPKDFRQRKPAPDGGWAYSLN